MEPSGGFNVWGLGCMTCSPMLGITAFAAFVFVLLLVRSVILKVLPAFLPAVVLPLLLTQLLLIAWWI